jgi:hypothetical protein
MKVSNKSLLRRIGSLTPAGLLVVAALVLAVIAVVVEERGVGPDVSVIKNWVLLAAAVLGIYLTVGTLRASPSRGGLALAIFVLLFYVSLQDLQYRRYTVLGMSASTVQMLLLVVLVAPMLARAVKIGVADVTPANVLARVR